MFSFNFIPITIFKQKYIMFTLDSKAIINKEKINIRYLNQTKYL